MSGRRIGLWWTSLPKGARRMAVPGAVAVLAAVTGPVFAGAQTSPASAVVGSIAGAIAGVSLWWVQRRPVTVLAVSLTATIVVAVCGCQVAASALAPLLALFFVGFSGRRTAIAVCGTTAAVLVPVAGWFLDAEPIWTLSSAGDVALVVAPLVAGIAVRSRRDYIAELTRRVELAELHRDEIAERAVGQERLRIARDLHDIVSHTISSINVQAGLAEHLLDRDPEVARDAVIAIKASSREAMHELREVLGLLRDPGETAHPTGTDRPAPGLDALPGLIEERRANGLPVQLRISVDPNDVTGFVQLATYRIVQEALTNVVSHAGAVATDVDVSRQGSRLLLRIENGPSARRPAPSTTSGVGIVGMRERVTALSGTLTAEQLPNLGFLVLAQLPLGVKA